MNNEFPCEKCLVVSRCKAYLDIKDRSDLLSHFKTFSFPRNTNRDVDALKERCPMLRKYIFQTKSKYDIERRFNRIAIFFELGFLKMCKDSKSCHSHVKPA